MKRGAYRALERLGLAAHGARRPHVLVETGPFLELLAHVQEVEAIRRLCGEAATWVGVEPANEIGSQVVARVRAQLWAVRKGEL